MQKFKNKVTKFSRGKIGLCPGLSLTSSGCTHQEYFTYFKPFLKSETLFVFLQAFWPILILSKLSSDVPSHLS